MHILTPRLMLRPYVETDFDSLARLFADASVTRYLFEGMCLSEQQVRDFIGQHFAASGSLGLGVLCELATSRVIGFAGLLEFEYLESVAVEFGFALYREAAGHGFATEIGLAQLEFGFSRLACTALYALVHPDNVLSERVIGKLGLTFQGQVEIPGRGPRRVFRVTRSDWSAAQSIERRDL